MVVLKKIKSATLIEAIVATVLIVIVFVIASLILNNLLLNTFSKNTHSIENRINELEYEVQHNTIQFPYQESYKGWEITIEQQKTRSGILVNFMATNRNRKKEITKQFAVWQQAK
ncbi:hypothetical protein D0817_05150 [Flavobacterium cupreum]|uniref:Type II secretion system protein n=1 Tax=Flavobacterium cupreum TaxID=2133766 RepID=A0A434AA73_9FLAO|nr:hypothetical protein [Flavobacterium cupreum]RUT71270.1 hypothetical protein D0817_05150 [Flavobacterium cupreum]